MAASEFFDSNADFYGALEPHRHDSFFIDFISKHTKKCNLLYIGGGGGCFTKTCKDHFQETNLCIVDSSKSLLNKQKSNGIKLVVGKLPDELNIDEKFECIHIKEVLHRVTGSSIVNSKKIVSESLINAQFYLNNDGYILVHELFYESYLIPTFTRTMIFYLLKIQNLLKIKIPNKHFLMNLDVCFYTRRELREIFKSLDFNVIDYYEEEWENSKYSKVGLIRHWGRMCFVLQRQTNKNDSTNISTMK